MSWVTVIVVYVLGFVISNVAFEEKDGKNHMGEHLFWFITIPMKLYKKING